MRKLVFNCVLLLALVIALGCRSARRGEPITGRLRLADPEVAKGQIVFYQHCHQCHPGGEGGLGPALNNKPAPAAFIKAQVRLGLGAMPEFDTQRISSKELDQLIAYLAALRKAE